LPQSETALIVGARAGLSAALARLFVPEGIQVALAARDTGKLAAVCDEFGARTFKCDASEPTQVDAMFDAVEAAQGSPDIVVYNASGRARGSLRRSDPV
jgi:NADP-dependent 3-hydroxy acid dehydrogenase YdfG